MLKTLEKETGKALALKCELFAKHGLNTVFFELNDEKGKRYILAISYDKFGKAVIEADKTAIWKGELFGRCSALFPFCKKILSAFKGGEKPEVSDFKGDYAPDFSLCRFDELYPKYKNKKLIITEEDSSTILPFYIKENTAVLGTWMCPISRAGLLAAVEYIFENYKQIKNIEYKNTPFSVLLDRGWRHNDYYLPLPRYVDELDALLSSKTRNTLRREIKKADSELNGLKFVYKEFKETPESWINAFYDYKYITHGLTKDSYNIMEHRITDSYALLTNENDINCVLFSCEQGPCVYAEVFAFNPELFKYSLGKIILNMYFKKLISKGKTGVALGGGDHGFKKHYGTFCATVYSGTITRKSYSIYKKLSKLGLGEKPISIRRWTERLS